MIRFILGGRVFHGSAVLLKKKFSKAVLFVFETYIIVVRIVVTSFITSIRGTQIAMNIGNYQTIS